MYAINNYNEIPNLEFYDCSNFLEIARIIKSGKFFLVEVRKEQSLCMFFNAKFGDLDKIVIINDK